MIVQHFFYNYFLKFLLFGLKMRFYLPDPFSFTDHLESGGVLLVSRQLWVEKLKRLLSHAFEDYLKSVFLSLFVYVALGRDFTRVKLVLKR